MAGNSGGPWGGGGGNGRDSGKEGGRKQPTGGNCFVGEKRTSFFKVPAGAGLQAWAC